jgi:hypothetical protein
VTASRIRRAAALVVASLSLAAPALARAQTCDPACDEACSTCCSSWDLALVCGGGEPLERKPGFATFDAARAAATTANDEVLACVGSRDPRCLAMPACSETWRLPRWTPVCGASGTIANPALVRRLTALRDADAALSASGAAVLERAQKVSGDAALTRTIVALSVAVEDATSAVATMSSALSDPELSAGTVDAFEKWSKRRGPELKRLSAATAAAVERLSVVPPAPPPAPPPEPPPRPAPAAPAAPPKPAPAVDPLVARREQALARAAELDTSIKALGGALATALTARSRAAGQRARAARTPEELAAAEAALTALAADVVSATDHAARLAAARAPVRSCEVALPAEDVVLDGVKRSAGSAPPRLVEGWHRIERGGKARSFLVLCDRVEKRTVTAP